MTEKQTVSKDDVARLTRGKRSKNRVGSRQIRHRLRQDELERLAVARERGYLLVTRSTRTALENAWHLDCLACTRPFVCVERIADGYHVRASAGGQSCVGVVARPEQWREVFSADMGG